VIFSTCYERMVYVVTSLMYLATAVVIHVGINVSFSILVR
jgi:hypothetical protein